MLSLNRACTTSDQGAGENFFKRIFLVETQSFREVLITYFKMLPDQKKWSWSVVKNWTVQYLQFIKCRAKKDCMINYLTVYVRAVSHTWFRSYERTVLMHSKDINGLTLTATFTFSDSPSDISASETRFNNRRSQKLTKCTSYSFSTSTDRNNSKRNLKADVRRILEIFRVV